MTLAFMWVSLPLSGAELEADEVWIDVRTWVEYQADNIAGDSRIHVSEIVEGVSSAYPDKETAIRLYCAVGGRAGKAAKLLQEAGYRNVKNVGGIEDARKARGLR